MTVIGKVLALMVFLFSLVFLGFAITINQLNKDPDTKKSWREVAVANRDEVKKANEDVKEMRRKTDELNVEITLLKSQLISEKDRIAKEADKAKKEAKQKDDLLVAAEGKFSGAEVALDAALKELEQRRGENTKYLAEIKDKNLQVAQIQADNTKLKNETIQAKLAAASAMDRLQGLEVQYRQVYKELEKTRELAAGKAAASTGGDQGLALSPPPQDVEGLVDQVSAKDKLVSITIGSDAGIARGHTLEVFRLKPEPEWVGIIKIEQVEPKRAVGKIVRQRVPVQTQDRVASSVLPRN
jgi:hypothetical protein